MLSCTICIPNTYIRIVVVVFVVSVVVVAIIKLKSRPVAGDVVTRFYNKLSK
jgi:hypothetical protein